MNDIKYALPAAYIGLLKDAMTVPKETWPVPVRPAADYTVPVYDSVPAAPTYPYVKVGEWTEVDYSDKTAFGSEVTLTLQIVDRYSGTAAPKAVRNVVTGLVKQIIRSRPVPFAITGWNVLTSVVDNETTFTDMDQTHTYVYNLIRFRHLCEQTT